MMGSKMGMGSLPEVNSFSLNYKEKNLANS
jgi:hypothetical protein